MTLPAAPPPADAPGIAIEGLTKRYEDLVAVDNLSLTIPRGEFFCFLGPNGAGKTTTIKVLTGLVRPNAGTARICGYDIQTRPVEAKRLIGYIPDHPYLYEKLSGRDFFHFVGDLFEVPADEQRRKCEDFFALLGLTRAADKLVENYSHGMRQKLVIAASLMHDPAVIIVDEPMVGLDPQSARTVKQLLRRQVERGCSVFLSTHILSIAEELADRIGIISRGRLIFLGTLEDLRARQNLGDARLEELFLSLTEDAAEASE
ncbi:MAG: ABC transporter ATP-binding protein [Candidatus Sumerlaeaceae bacterium]|nr:ABC transporter ATP-binding protein [Candidatus Sumerlaeaceae bacterium]